MLVAWPSCLQQEGPELSVTSTADLTNAIQWPLTLPTLKRQCCLSAFNQKIRAHGAEISSPIGFALIGGEVYWIFFNKPPQEISPAGCRGTVRWRLKISSFLLHRCHMHIYNRNFNAVFYPSGVQCYKQICLIRIFKFIWVMKYNWHKSNRCLPLMFLIRILKIC